MGIGRRALPLDQKFILPAEKPIGKEILVQAAAKLMNIATRNKSPKQALKNNKNYNQKTSWSWT